jgi:hypothetical protein
MSVCLFFLLVPRVFACEYVGAALESHKTGFFELLCGDTILASRISGVSMGMPWCVITFPLASPNGFAYPREVVVKNGGSKVGRRHVLPRMFILLELEFHASPSFTEASVDSCHDPGLARWNSKCRESWH